MITTLLIVLACCVALGFLGSFAIRYPSLPAGADLAKHLVPINLPALLNLMDPSQRDFLRRNLSPADFRSIARERNRVALSYTKKISNNIAILTRWAELARISAPDGTTARAAAELATLGVRTRLYVLAVILLLYADCIFPDLVELKDVVARYETLTGQQAAVATAHAGGCYE